MIHGGNIPLYSERFNIPVEQWIDLSTGVNPIAYPFDPVDRALFQRLPYQSSKLMSAAADYYGSDQLLPVAGSQAAIQQLPLLLSAKQAHNKVLLPRIGYQEHAYHWQRAGAVLKFYPSSNFMEAKQVIDDALHTDPAQHLVIINPNNPTTLKFSQEQLIRWAGQLAAGYYLIVDEAFVDIYPGASMLNGALLDNIVVLRSFGKFFGLAGVRLGAVFSSSALLAELNDQIGPWAINGPAQQVAVQAYRDSVWQKSIREKLHRLEEKNVQLWRAFFASLQMGRGGTGWRHTLFSTYQIPKPLAYKIQQQFCALGVLLRLIPDSDAEKALLRVGLVDVNNADRFRRLKRAMAEVLAILKREGVEKGEKRDESDAKEERVAC